MAYSETYQRSKLESFVENDQRLKGVFTKSSSLDV